MSASVSERKAWGPHARWLAAGAVVLGGVAFGLPREDAAAEALPSTTTELPWSALVVGPARGQVEPCGCSGGQLGGVDRLATVLATAPPLGIPPGPKLAAGGVIALEAAAHDPWAGAQLDAFWQVFQTLGFDAIGLGALELEQTARIEELAFLLAPTQLVASNLEVAGGHSFPGAPVPVFAKDGVTMLSFTRAGLSGSFELPPSGAEADSPDAEPQRVTWQTTDPVQALTALTERGLWDASRPTLAFLEDEHAVAERLAAKLGPSSFVLVVGDEMEASSTTPPGTGILEIGSRLRQVLRLAGGVAEHQRVHEMRVSEAVPGDPGVEHLKTTYRMLLEYYDARSVVADSLPSEGQYVGAQSCMPCHAEAFEIWNGTRHAHAWQTLLDDQRGGISAAVDPRCVKCHTSGYGRVDGFGSAKHPEAERWSASSALVNVSCETCHGPGAAHASSADKTKIERGGEYTCLRCHDAENDPAFRYAERWVAIDHLTSR